jgi:tetratricopeptide (TPR) repeat protein
MMKNSWRVHAVRIAVACVLPSAAAARATGQSPDARLSYARGLAALHLFEYQDANEAFLEAQRLDPGLAMAYWGEAMTYNQTLWRKEDIAAGRRALARLGQSPAARASKAGTAKEKALIAGVEILFGDGDSATRHRRYADAMARAYTQAAEDPDVASFYALALLGTMSRSLIGHDDAHEGRTAGLAGSEVQKHVGEILSAVLKSQADHPGALHYLLHNYDDPAHASLGLAAARRLAAGDDIARGSSHALHMPSHIFLQLGMWRDAAASDRAAFDASTAWIARKRLGPEARNYHALGWLEYELLQRGRYRAARQTIDELEPVVKATGLVPLLSDLASMRARYAIETRQWETMGRERNFANVDDLFAIGVSAARLRDPDLAERARQGLASRATSEREGDLRPAIAIMEREVAALIELGAGRTGPAVEILQAAARAELELPPPLGLPEPVKPAPELLGEVLLEAGRPREAIEPFEHALRRNPNRSLSVLGLARAHAALGETDASRARYRELLANYDEADPDLPELDEARRALDTPTAPLATQSDSRLRLSAVIALGAAALITVAVVIYRRPRPGTKKRARTRRTRS